MTRHFHLALCSAFVFLTLFILQADARTCVFAQDSVDSFSAPLTLESLSGLQESASFENSLAPDSTFLPSWEDSRNNLATSLGVDALPQDYTDNNGGEFRLIKTGNYAMGSTLTGEEVMKKYPNNLKAEFFDNAPITDFGIEENFYLCKYPVTRGEFRKFVNATGYETTAERIGSALAFTKEGKWENVNGANWKNPGFEQTDSHPVVCVSYFDALAYIQWLNNAVAKSDDRLGGFRPLYALPTEWLWEYGCRAGTTGEFFWGDKERDGEGYLNAADKTNTPIGDAWFDRFSFSDNYSATSPVGSFKPNPWGLCDMLGNVWEWMGNSYYEYLGSADPVVNPKNPISPTETRFVLRGGSWSFGPAQCRCAFRFVNHPGASFSGGGFRVAFGLTKAPQVVDDVMRGASASSATTGISDLENRISAEEETGGKLKSLGESSAPSSALATPINQETEIIDEPAVIEIEPGEFDGSAINPAIAPIDEPAVIEGVPGEFDGSAINPAIVPINEPAVIGEGYGL